MSPQPPPPPVVPDFRQHLEVETPEHVVLDYEIAGLGSRALAAVLDTGLLVLWSIALAFAVGLVSAELGSLASVVLIVGNFLAYWGYFTLFEGLRGGQTPGKRRLGIRVVQDTGHPVSFGAAAVRNLLRVADFLPPPYLLGALFVGFHPRGKRLGDIVAGTVVVRDAPAVQLVEPVGTSDVDPTQPAGTPELADGEFRVVREYAERAASLPEEVRARLAARLAARFAARFPSRPTDPEQFLLAVFRDELHRRRGRFGARGGKEGKRDGGGGVVERLVARKSSRWDEFHALAERAAAGGLDRFEAAELPDYAARYREVAADLARARTYRAPAPVLARLERLVAAGHNTLYRDERRTGRQIWRFLARECPAAVVQARFTVGLAFLTFALPALAGYLLLRELPRLADEVLPAVMLERAEAGPERTAGGRGYVEVEAGDRPQVASSLMANNIGVAFNCFAGGIFAGVGSLVLLAYNGLAIGATSGHYANVGLLGYLWSFVIGHGVLELFAIWVAGAAGFLLGRALIAPGELARGDALVLAGRLAMRMLGTVIVLLLIAGGIEGFVSASTAPLALRLGVSGASLLFLLAYLGSGWVSQRKAVGRPPVAGGLSGNAGAYPVAGESPRPAARG